MQVNNYFINFELFMKNLKIYYDLAMKSNRNTLNKFSNKELIFRNSFLFSNSLGNYKILNSISDLMKEEINFENKNDLLMYHYKKILVSYYENCPDLSNLYVILSYEFFANCKSKFSRNIVGKELKFNMFVMIDKLKRSILDKVIKDFLRL